MEKLLALIRDGGSAKQSGEACVERGTAAAVAECGRKSKEESLADAIVELFWESLPERECAKICAGYYFSNPYPGTVTKYTGMSFYSSLDLIMNK